MPGHATDAIAPVESPVAFAPYVLISSRAIGVYKAAVLHLFWSEALTSATTDPSPAEPAR
jgi:hypothetical protein